MPCDCFGRKIKSKTDKSESNERKVSKPQHDSLKLETNSPQLDHLTKDRPKRTNIKPPTQFKTPDATDPEHKNDNN